MAAGSFLTLFDDIASVLDDVAAMTKVAARKTAGVLGDDLALNAEQVTGVRASRELPVVWAVAKGSMLNKAILVPAALLISAILPFLIQPLLMLGGAYLCFEGFEKVFHKLFHAEDEAASKAAHKQANADPEVDLAAVEQAKIKGAVRTDFILSAEIVVLALGVVKEQDFWVRVGSLSVIAVLMTVGVYGLVAVIVKLDDLGAYLAEKDDPRLQKVGGWLLTGAPYLMKGLSIAGTAAMFLVGGGILVHGIPPLHHVEHAVHEALAALAPLLNNALVGFSAGALLLGLVQLWTWVKAKRASA